MRPEAIPKGPIAKILYIEDDLGLARLLRKNLQRLGYAVELAFSGEDGLRVIGEQPFDILLVDHHLPGMSGLDVIEALRLDKIPIPIVMVTAHGSELVAVEALKRGACDYLVKDVELHYLQLLPVIVQKLLNQQRLILGCYRTMETLRAAEESYRKVMEGIGDGIMVSVQGRIEMLNPAGSILFGLDSPEQAIGRSLDEFFLPADPETAQTSLDQQPDAGRAVQNSARKLVRQAGGQLQAVAIRELPLRYQGECALITVFSPPEQ